MNTLVAEKNVKSNTDKLISLQSKLGESWRKIIERSELIKHILAGKIDKKLFAIYMYETYHYTYHNARNQALVGSNSKNIPVNYMKFCFDHANEETGHELMALHDIRELGVDIQSQAIPEPLHNTEIMIAYLYWISTNGNPLQRLGYSFWAENCYEYINPIIGKIKQTLNLQDYQLTFFIAHSNIDEDHAKEVQDMILKFVKTDEDWESVEKVMNVTLQLQERILEGVFEEYQNIESGKKSRYSFLNMLS